LRMQCDVPFGAYLSGGVDSSSVVSLMCRHQTKPVVTFSLGYTDEPQGQFAGKAQDVVYAKLMSQRLHTHHHEYLLGAEEFAERLPDVLRAFDEPFSGTVSTYFLSILIHQHVKVALSGDGADELFGSYLAHRLSWPIFHYLRLRQQGKGEFAALSPIDLQLLAPFDSEAQFSFLKSLALLEQPAWRMQLAVFTDQEKQDLLTPEFLEAAVNPCTQGIYEDLLLQGSARDPLNINLEVDQRELLPNQVLPFVDRLSMAHSIEVRCPYLDYRIIEFANRLPGNFKINNGSVKYVHKKAMENLLPKDLLQRPKEGFVQPIYSWMEHTLHKWVKNYLSRERLARHGLIRPERVAEILREHYAGQVNHSARIWNLICFQVWHDSVLNSTS